jgi:hypothetical protein
MVQPLLVVFNDRGQMQEFRRFFPAVEGDFKVYGDALLGARYQRVVAFRPVREGCSSAEYQFKIREMHEHIPCRVAAGGEFSIM